MKIAASTTPATLATRKARINLAVNERMSSLASAVRRAAAIADSEDRLDIARLGRVRLDLLPQVADMHIHRALHPVIAVALEPFQQELAGEDPPRRGHQRRQQLELRWR